MVDDTTERAAKLFAMFKVAIEDERRAQSMYHDVLKICHDTVMRGVVEDLYRDEVRHEKRLLAEYRRLRDAVGEGGQDPGPAPARH